ncbi:MAG: hypothetical protein Q9226_004838 [Calogaya cf. arnoldii]
MLPVDTPFPASTRSSGSVINLPDLRTPNISAQNYIAGLRILKSPLNLDLSTLSTSMLFGASTTTEMQSITDLQWTTSQTTINNTKYDTISTTPPNRSSELWMSLSRPYFNQLLPGTTVPSHGDFNASLPPDDIPYNTDAFQLAGESLYHSNAGPHGLQIAPNNPGNQFD